MDTSYLQKLLALTASVDTWSSSFVLARQKFGLIRIRAPHSKSWASFERGRASFEQGRAGFDELVETLILARTNDTFQVV